PPSPERSEHQMTVTTLRPGAEIPLANGNGHRPDTGGVAVYGRVSSEEQRENKNIDTQVEFGRSYCTLPQPGEPPFYLDGGGSGPIPPGERPDGRRLLNDARAGKVRLLFVYKLDRIGRDTRRTLNAIDDLKRAGVEVRSMTEPFDTSTPAGQL